jgi:hypothetical protein
MYGRQRTGLVLYGMQQITDQKELKKWRQADQVPEVKLPHLAKGTRLPTMNRAMIETCGEAFGL